MPVNAILDSLRAQFPLCDMIAYADLSVDMVLATSADQKITQERWEALCATAHAVLRGPDTTDILVCLDASPSDGLGRAVLMNGGISNLVLAACNAPDFVFCAMGQADLDAAKFFQVAQPILDDLVRDD